MAKFCPVSGFLIVGFSSRYAEGRGYLTISTSRSAVSISPISESTWRKIKQGLSATLPSISFSFSWLIRKMFNYPHLLGALVEGVVEENGDMFMLVHQMDKVLASHICNVDK